MLFDFAAQTWAAIGWLLVQWGGAAAVAYAVFRYFSKSWLDNHFAKQLESFRHDQQKELQRLRLEIDSLLSGTIKLQERDFQILPDAWEKLQNAAQELSSSVSALQSYPDIGRLSSVELELFLKEDDVPPIVKERILGAADTSRNELYQSYTISKKIRSAHNAIADLKVFIDRNAIFFPADIKREFLEISKLMWSAMISKNVGHEAKDWKMQSEANKELQDTILPKIATLESRMSAHLRAHGK